MAGKFPQPATTPVYDISGEKPVLGDMPHDQVQAAVASGQFTFPKGQEVSVVSPDGTFGSVPAEQAPEALKNGYQYATPSMLGEQQDKETYSTTGQQAIAGLEGVAQGVAGPLAPLAERALGVNPEGIRKRAEQNPWTHGLAESGGFGAGLLTGSSEAALLGHAGEAVTGALKLGGEGASVVSRLGAGAAKMATEMGLYAAGDEATKAILEDPSQTVGSAVSNVGLNTLLGAVGGAPLTALGMGAKGIINSQLLKDFSERLSFRGSNLNPTEMLQHELSSGVNSFGQIGDEVTGFGGLKAQAISKLLPETVTPQISTQIQDVATKAQDAFARMAKEEVPPRLAKDFQWAANRFLETATNPEASVGDHFDALNQFKNDIQDYAKGRYGINAPQRTAEDFQFLKITKELGADIKNGLEHSGTWGDAADVQKQINKAWSESIPAVKDVTKKFMSKVGNEYAIDPQKFMTYMNQNGKATSQTIRQQMMGKFVDAMEQFHDTVANVAEKAGIENPIEPISLNSLRESVSKTSPGTKLADLWFDKLGAKGLGDASGAAVVGGLGHMTGIPGAGLGGALLGKEILGPSFTALIKPMLEKGVNLGGVRSGLAYAKAVLKGDAQLTTAAASVFGSASKTLPSHLVPAHAELEKLDDRLKDVAANPAPLMNVAGNLGHYAPDHAQALSQTAMTAVNYLNTQRPMNPKQSPLDPEIPLSKSQKAPYFRSLSIAQQPLSVLEHIKNGTLLPQDVHTVTTLYPAFYNKMSQKLLGAMNDHLSKEGSVPYRTRQSMSLFLGQPMDSTLVPQNMQAIQAMYAQRKAASQPQPGSAPTKKGTSKLGKIASNMQTTEQSRAERASQ